MKSFVAGFWRFISVFKPNLVQDLAPDPRDKITISRNRLFPFYSKPAKLKTAAAISAR